MNEDFVTYEQAVKLKELGFDWECNYYYDIETKEFIENHIDYSPEDSFNPCSSYDDHNRCWDCVSAPTLAQAQKWLYEKYGLWINVERDMVKTATFNCAITRFGDITRTWVCWFDSPIKAISKGIDEAIKLAKKEEQRNKRWYE